MSGPEIYVLLHHLPLSALNGAVAVVKFQEEPTADQPRLLCCEVLFPRSAKEQHAHVKVPLENASVYDSLDKPLPAGVSAQQVLLLANRNAELLFEAVAADLLPGQCRIITPFWRVVAALAGSPFLPPYPPTPLLQRQPPLTGTQTPPNSCIS